MSWQNAIGNEKIYIEKLASVRMLICVIIIKSSATLKSANCLKRF